MSFDNESLEIIKLALCGELSSVANSAIENVLHNVNCAIKMQKNNKKVFDYCDGERTVVEDETGMANVFIADNDYVICEPGKEERRVYGRTLVNYLVNSKLTMLELEEHWFEI